MQNKQQWVEKLLSILKGLTIAYLITLLGILGLAFGLYKWNLSASTVEIGIIVIYVISCLMGGIVTGRKAEQKRFFWGLLVGAVYFLILLLMSASGGQQIASGGKRIFLAAVVCLGAGMLGGMLVKKEG